MTTVVGQHDSQRQTLVPVIGENKGLAINIDIQIFRVRRHLSAILIGNRIVVQTVASHAAVIVVAAQVILLQPLCRTERTELHVQTILQVRHLGGIGVGFRRGDHILFQHIQVG